MTINQNTPANFATVNVSGKTRLAELEISGVELAVPVGSATEGNVGELTTTVSVSCSAISTIYITTDAAGETLSNSTVAINTGTVLEAAAAYDLVAPVGGVIELTVTGAAADQVDYVQIVTGGLTKTITVTTPSAA